MPTFIIFLLILAAYAYFYWLPKLILHPRRLIVPAEFKAAAAGFEPVALTTAGGYRLAALFAPASPPQKGNLIVLHGIGSSKEVYLEYAAELNPLGINVLLYDARAHGASGGNHVTYGYYEWEDVGTAVAWLGTQNNLPTGVFGHSMGGAVAVQALARRQDIAFGIVESAFTDLSVIVHAYAKKMVGIDLPESLTRGLLERAGEMGDFEPFTVQPVVAATQVTQPVLVVHGAQDSRVAPENAEQLYAALGSTRKELFLIPGADHDDVAAVGGNHYWARLTEFIYRNL